jgi:hypothetical protein
MNTQSTVLDNASVEATTPDRILQTALAAWRQGNFVEVADQFSDQFTFIDHALELEFRDKERLTEFLANIIELFSDSERATETTSLVKGRLRLRIPNLFWADICEKCQFTCEAYLSRR